MNTTDLIQPNPFITVDNESVTLAFTKKKYNFNLADISKIYISKRRPGYIAALLDNLLSVHEMRYTLNIQTPTELNKIQIDPLQRYYCLKLIHELRKHEGSNAIFV